MSAPPGPQHPSRVSLPPNIRRSLERLSRKDTLLRVVRFPLMAFILLPLIWLAQGAIDFVFNLPWAARLALMLGSVALLGWLFFRHVIIPLTRRLTLRTAALLAERKFPEFRTSLISAVDFTSGKGSSNSSSELVRILLGNVSRRVDGVDLVRGIVDTKPAWKLAGAALAVAGAVGAVMWFTQPQSFVLGRRVFLSLESLPRRTNLEPITRDFVVDTGADAEIAVRAQGVIPSNGRVVVSYADGRRETLAVSASPVELGEFRLTLRNTLQSFKYHFEINDGSTGDFAVSTRTLPTLISTRFLQAYPGYTGKPTTELSAGSLALLAGGSLIIEAEANQPLQKATLDLIGLERSIQMDNGNPANNLRIRIEEIEPKLGPLQAKIEKLKIEMDASAADVAAAEKIEAEAQKTREAVPAGDERRALDFKWAQTADALRLARGVAAVALAKWTDTTREYDDLRNQAANFKRQLDAALSAPQPDAATLEKQKRTLRAQFDIPRERLTGLSMHLVNEAGIESRNDPIYRVNLVVDKPPIAEITEPKGERKTVLAGDTVTIRFRIRDDYKIEGLTLRYVVVRPNPNGEDERAEENSIPMKLPEGTTTTASGGHVWNLASFVPPLVEGCSLTYWLEATDHYTLYAPTKPMSRKAILAVVSPEEKRAEFIAEMEKTAKEINRLSERQRRANEKTDSELRR